MRIFTFKSKYPYGSNCYAVESDGEFALIDPSLDFESVISTLGVDKSQFKYIIVTHAHFDHILTANEWSQELGLPITVPKKDEKSLSDPHFNCYKLFFNESNGYYGDTVGVSEGDKLPLGNTYFEVFETPGHTQGSSVFKIDSALFVGDTVFAEGGVGRTDLPGGNYFELADSIKRILSFDASFTVYPGHGPKTLVSKLMSF